MKKSLSALCALFGPTILLVVLCAITYQVESTIDMTVAPLPCLMWYLVLGILAACYLALTVLFLPKSPGSTLTLCAILGAVLAVVLCVLELSAFGILADFFPFHVVLPIRMETLLLVPLTGLLVVGNLTCAILARRNLSDN